MYVSLRGFSSAGHFGVWLWIEANEAPRMMSVIWSISRPYLTPPFTEGNMGLGVCLARVSKDLGLCSFPQRGGPARIPMFN